MFYKFNLTTKEYIDESNNAYYNLDGNLIDGYTNINPPTFTNDEICKFIDGQWQVSPKPKDYRGTWVNINDDIQNITELDILPQDGYAKENNSIWYFVDGTEATDITNAQITKRKWVEVRSKRDGLLKNSDIYMLIDNYNNISTTKQTDWKTYRQTLRDIPQTYTNVDNVVYPDEPSLS